MLYITNHNFYEQVSAIANGTVEGRMIDFELEEALTPNQLVALGEAFKKNPQKRWSFTIKGDIPLRTELLQSLPSFCADISYIKVSEPPLTTDDITTLEGIFTKNKSPMNLHIVLDPTFSTNGFLDLLLKIKSSNSLARLGINNTPDTNKHATLLVSNLALFLQNNNSLKELKLHNLNVKEQEDINLLTEALEHNHSIEILTFNGNRKPLESFLIRNSLGKPSMKNSVLDLICEYLKNDFENNNFPAPERFYEFTQFMTDDERAVVIHRLERHHNDFAQLACAYLLFPETNFYNLIASYTEQFSPTDEAKSHAAITFLLQVSSNAQLKRLADTMLYFFKIDSPFESVKNRLSTIYLNPDEQYTKLDLSDGAFRDDRGPTAMPSIPTKPLSFFSQNRNTSTINPEDTEGNDPSYESKAP